jgi:hypothetical protein
MEENVVEASGIEETHRSLVTRVAALAGIAFVAVSFAPGSLGGPIFSDISSAQIVDWAKHNAGAINLEGFLGGFSASLLAVFVFLLVSGFRGRGLLAMIASGSIAAFLGVDWAHAGVYYALADAGQRGQADAGLVALFSLAKSITFADGFVFGMAVIALSLVAMRSRSLPVPLVWLGLGMGTFHLVETPVQMAINQSAGGVTGPVDVVLTLLWILAVSVVLLIKPVWSTQPRPSVSAAAS